MKSVVILGILLSLTLTIASVHGILAERPLDTLQDSGAPKSEVTGVYRHQLLQPLDFLVKHESVLIAVVEPVRRRDAVALSGHDLATMKHFQEQRTSRLSEYPFTPVEVNVEESLKGDLTGKLVVWEERGDIRGLHVESDDPYLSVGARGLLLAGRHDNGAVVPLIFAPIDDSNYMASLDMSLDDFKEMITGK